MGVLVWWEMSPMRAFSFSFSASTFRAETVEAAR